MVTIRDVARESGFSSTTVSIVLNNAPLARYIPAITKKRIERAAKKLGYRPNLFARSLRSKRSHTVGVMVFDMTDPFCTLVLRGIEVAFDRRVAEARAVVARVGAHHAQHALEIGHLIGVTHVRLRRPGDRVQDSLRPVLRPPGRRKSREPRRGTGR